MQPRQSECRARECEKALSRARSRIWMLTRELEAARASIDELEVEIERLEQGILDDATCSPAAYALAGAGESSPTRGE